MVHREEDVDEEGEEESCHEETDNREQLKKDSSRELHDDWSGEGRQAVIKLKRGRGILIKITHFTLFDLKSESFQQIFLD